DQRPIARVRIGAEGDLGFFRHALIPPMNEGDRRSPRQNLPSPRLCLPYQLSGFLQTTLSSACLFSCFTTCSALARASGTSLGSSTRAAEAPQACAVSSKLGDGLKSVPGKFRVRAATPSGYKPRAALRLAFQT